MSKKSRTTAPVKTNPQSQRPAAGQQTQIIAQQHAWKGPLPSPDQLARFDSVVPGTAERIIRMAEQEGEHSREVQMRAVRATVRLQHIGQSMAFVLASGALGAAYFLAMANHDAVATSLVVSGVVGIAVAFLNILKNNKD